MVNVGIVGCGYWGPKLVKNFYELPDSNLVSVCDLDESRLLQTKKLYPHISITTCFKDLLQDEIDAVVIATPANTHYELAKEALSRNKHVFVENPMTASYREAEDLIRIARLKKRMLMTGQIYEYHPAVDFLKKLIQSGELGEIYSMDASRLNLGLFRPDVNVIWDLGSHDINIILSLMNQDPLAVSARGFSHLDSHFCDQAYLELIFANETAINIHLSWLNPRKVRQLTIIGSKKMAFYDDVAEVEKIYLYDKGCSLNSCTANLEAPGWPPHYRQGDVTIPFVSNAEPLRLECQHFLESIREGKTPKTDGLAGLKIINILEAANQSLSNGGQPVTLPSFRPSIHKPEKYFVEIK